MVIKVNGKEFAVTELAQKWKVERAIGGVSVVYEVPKEIAPDAAAVERYIEERNEIF